MTNQSICFLCLGSNTDRCLRMEAARQALKKYFPNIRFSQEMETKALGEGMLSPFSNQIAQMETDYPLKQIRRILKDIEANNGRMPEDKQKGIVKMDIDILTYGQLIIKPDDLQRDYVQEGIKALS